MPRDLTHSALHTHAIAAQSLGATGSGGKVSRIIDRAGFGSIGFSFNYGSIAATNATVAVSFQDGDATGSMANVTGALILGSPSIGATSARASGVSKNVAKHASYIGLKRYLKVTMAPTVSGGIIASCTAILGDPRSAPVGADT